MGLSIRTARPFTGVTPNAQGSQRCNLSPPKLGAGAVAWGCKRARLSSPLLDKEGSACQRRGRSFVSAGGRREGSRQRTLRRIDLFPKKLGAGLSAVRVVGLNLEVNAWKESESNVGRKKEKLV